MRVLYPDNTFVGPKFPEGNKDLVRLVIAEAPGEQESIEGAPLVGGSGKWFDSMLLAAGIDRAGLTIINCIQCRPPKNVFPTDPEAKSYISKEDANKAISQCYRNHVEPVIKSRNWSRIDLLGDKPLRIIAKRDGGIFKWRGSPVDITGVGKGPVAIPILHPAYVARDQVMFPVCVNDLKKSLEIPQEYYTPYGSLEDLQNFKYTHFAFDIETNGHSNEIKCIGLCARPNFAMVVPFRGAYIPELKRLFHNAESIVGHNCIQFDLPILRGNGVEQRPGCMVFDTMLLQHLLFPDFPHDLEFVGSQFSSKPAWKGEKGSLEIYCCRDTDVTLQCFNQLLPMVKRENFFPLYRDVTIPLAKICRLMHETGFKVDTNRIQHVRAKLELEREREERYLPEFLKTRDKAIKKRIPAPPGTLGKSGKPVKYIHIPATERVVPWRSPAAKQRYLYSKDEGCLGIEPILDAKTGNITTGKIALHKIYARTHNRAVEAIRRLNQLDETLSTFAKEDMVRISRMYPHFNVHGTASGRLSSSDPNLQNIPEAARIIYVPSHAGWKIVDVDYSQIENRLTAYFAGDVERLGRFQKDPKFSEHKYAASLFLGVDYNDVVKDNDKDAPYGKAKRIVHGTNYGMGAKKISNLFDLDLRDVRNLQDTWKNAIRPTIDWQNRCGKEAKDKGYLTTPFLRKRWFWTSSYYTEALSFLPQSTAADVIFRAMIGLMYERIGLERASALKVAPISVPLPKPARLLLQVHDSLIFECPESMVDEVVKVVRTVMEQPWRELGGMHIPIGVKIGDSWGECEDYKP